jgi:hypothetical protein
MRPRTGAIFAVIRPSSKKAFLADEIPCHPITAKPRPCHRSGSASIRERENVICPRRLGLDFSSCFPRLGWRRRALHCLGRPPRPDAPIVRVRHAGERASKSRGARSRRKVLGIGVGFFKPGFDPRLDALLENVGAFGEFLALSRQLIEVLGRDEPLGVVHHAVQHAERFLGLPGCPPQAIIDVPRHLLSTQATTRRRH